MWEGEGETPSKRHQKKPVPQNSMEAPLHKRSGATKGWYESYESWKRPTLLDLFPGQME